MVLTEIFGGTANQNAVQEIYNSLNPVKGLIVSFDDKTGDFSVSFRNTAGHESMIDAFGMAHEFYQENLKKIPGVLHVDNFKFKTI